MRRLLLGAAVLPLLTGLTACSTALTPDRLGPSFAETFGGLYVAQQTGSGRTDVDRASLRPLALCRRTGTSPSGPGQDWTCTARYRDAVTEAQTFEVEVRANGCWTAQGAAAQQPAELVDASGRRRTNPLAVFDGCLDPSL